MAVGRYAQYLGYFTHLLSLGDLTPPHWVNTGAMAISTLAGAELARNAPDAPFLASLLPFIDGFTVLYWATGTCWTPAGCGHFTGEDLAS